MKKECLGLALWGLTAIAAVQAEETNDTTRVITLQEVEVSSSRATYKTPIAYSDVSKQEIEKNNYGQDIPYLLLQTPSVIVTSDAGTGIGYTGFRIRGTDANRINVTTNGIPLNDSESHGVFWVNMPDFASSLQDLQVQRGVGTSTAGAGAFGASINMKTDRTSNQAYGELNGSYGSFNTSKATVKLGSGLLNGRWAFDARLSSIESDGYIDRASVDLKSYFVQGGYYGEKTLLKLLTFGGKEQTYHAWDGVPYGIWDGQPTGAFLPDRKYNPSGYRGDDAQGNPLYYDNQTDNYMQTHYQLHLLQVLSPELQLNAALHYTKGDGYYEEYKTASDLTFYGLIPFEQGGAAITSTDLVRRKFLDNHFGGIVLSLNYKKDRWDVHFGGAANRYVGNHFGQVIWTEKYVGNWKPDHEYYRGLGHKNDANLYLKGTYALTSRLSLYGDLQYRFIDYKIGGVNDAWDFYEDRLQSLDIRKYFNFFNPKTGLFWQIDANNDVYASFAVAHREPNRNNYTNAGFETSPVAERLQDYEWGYTYKERDFSAGVNFYYMRYKDQLVLTGKTNEIGEPLTSNIPDSYRMGVEVMAGWKIVPCLRWDANLTVSRNRIKEYSEFVDYYRYNVVTEEYDWDHQQENKIGDTPISFSPDWIANNLFSFSRQQWSASLQSSYVGKQYVDNTGNNDRKIDPYFVNNLRLGYTFQLPHLKSLGLSVAVNNLFNEKYETNAWVYSGLYEADGKAVRGDDFGYFPQAGTNVLVNVSLKF